MMSKRKKKLEGEEEGVYNKGKIPRELVGPVDERKREKRDEYIRNGLLTVKPIVLPPWVNEVVQGRGLAHLEAQTNTHTDINICA